MHRLLTTIVLFLAAHVASAQCVNSTPPAVGAAAPHKMELIKTAAAETRGTAIAQMPPAASQDEAATTEHRRRTGPAALVAALALMAGIALRRSSASGQ